MRKKIFVFASNFAIDSKIRNRSFFFNHSFHKFIDSKSIYFVDERFLSIKINLTNSDKNLSYKVKNVRNWLNSDLKFEISLIVFVDLLTIFEFGIFEKSYSKSAESMDLTIFLSVKKEPFFFKLSKTRISVFNLYFVYYFYLLL